MQRCRGMQLYINSFAYGDVDVVQVRSRWGIKFDCICTYKLQTRTHRCQLGANAFEFQLEREAYVRLPIDFHWEVVPDASTFI